MTSFNQNKPTDFIDTQKEADERLKKMSGDGTRLRRETACKVVATGFIEPDGHGGYKIADYPLHVGMELEIKLDDHWLSVQVEPDAEGKMTFSGPGFSFYPLKIYGRILRIIK